MLSKPWQRCVLPATLHGGRADSSTTLAAVPFNVVIELASKAGHIAGLSLDRTKCFDSFDARFGFGVLTALVFDPRCQQTMTLFYSASTRFFRIGKTVGKPFHSHSLFQGCSLSILVINSLFSVFVRHLQDRAPLIKPIFYVDDCHLYTDTGNVPQLQDALQCSIDFDTLTGQSVNSAKSFTFSTDPSTRKQLASLFHDPMPKTQGLLLGHPFTVHNNKNTATSNVRIQQALQVLRRISCIPVTKFRLQQLIVSNVVPKFLHGTESQFPSLAALHKLGSQVLRTLFSEQRLKRERSLAFLLTTSFCRTEPVVAVLSHVFRSLRSVWLSSPDTRLLLTEHWDHIFTLPKLTGPCAGLATLLHHFQIQPLTPGSFQNLQGLVVSWNDPPNILMFWLQRTALYFLSAKIIRTRKDTATLPIACIDLTASTILHTSTRLPRSVKHALSDCLVNVQTTTLQNARATISSITTGSTMTADRMYAASILPSAVCPFCGQEDETQSHMLPTCPRWDELRHQYPTKPSPCHRSHAEQTLAILSEQDFIPSRLLALQQTPFPKLSPLSSQHVTEFWIDGSCHHPYFPAIASATFAVVWKPWSLHNSFSCQLPGVVQNAARAEVAAALAALQLANGQCVIHTDCLSVLKVIRKLPSLSPAHIANLPNGDLWKQAAEILSSRGRDIVFAKVKAHATPLDLAQEKSRPMTSKATL